GDPIHADPDALHAFLERIWGEAPRCILDTVRVSHSEGALEEDLVYAMTAGASYDDLSFLLRVYGEVQEIAGMDSADFAVMTAGSASVYAVRRSGAFQVFSTGDECMFDFASSGTDEDDPDLRRVRLEIAEAFGGLGPGMWIA